MIRPASAVAVAVVAMTALVGVVLPLEPTTVRAQTLAYRRQPDARRGKQIYDSGCITCHGRTGRGASQERTEFTRPSTFPDFTRCDQTTPEPNPMWKAVIVQGGPARGFSPIMPAFGRLLSSDQIDDVIAFLRTFCTNEHWARGELNLPRPLVTEKAFPENEAVLSSAVNASGAPGSVTDVVHEQRFGVRNQIEIDVPVNVQRQDGRWQSGVGDIALGFKRQIYSNLKTGSILSLFGGVLAPTGDSTLGFGNGTTTFETFAAFGQLFPSNTFFQLQAGAELPWDSDIAPRAAFFRMAIGQTIAPNHRLGRMWSPMIEFLADRDLVGGAPTNWDMVPEMQVTLSRRQHVRANVGIRTPMNHRAGRHSQVLFYVLWDWADGALWEGWK